MQIEREIRFAAASAAVSASASSKSQVKEDSITVRVAGAGGHHSRMMKVAAAHDKQEGFPNVQEFGVRG